MWKPNNHKMDSNHINAAEIVRDAGFIPARIYGNLAQMANRLKLKPLDDNVRYLQMGLLAQEIGRKSINGAIAELGVFRGGFSRYISRAFKDKRYYLFDTFEGFDEQQIRHDSINYGATGDDFSDTSVNTALKEIDPRNNLDVIVKKGFFPATTEGVDDTFCFVSIDADLYEPTIEGLRFFYPRMARGGYIMVHDLMAQRYQGCRQAVYEFSEKEDVSFVPLPDAICSALFIR